LVNGRSGGEDCRAFVFSGYRFDEQGVDFDHYEGRTLAFGPCRTSWFLGVGKALTGGGYPRPGPQLTPDGNGCYTLIGDTDPLGDVLEQSPGAANVCGGDAIDIRDMVTAQLIAMCRKLFGDLSRWHNCWSSTGTLSSVFLGARPVSTSLIRGGM
jgi:hypothetical protein